MCPNQGFSEASPLKPGKGYVKRWGYSPKKKRGERGMPQAAARIARCSIALWSIFD